MSSPATLSPAVPKPDHVPEALVYDFDLFNDPELLVRGYDRIAEIAHNAPPVFWSPRTAANGFCVAMRPSIMRSAIRKISPTPR